MHKHLKVAAGKFVLPPELWEEIYKRLVLSDRIRFSSLGIISPKLDGPPPVTELWPLLSHGVSSNLCKNRFHCLSHQRVYTFGNVIPYGGCVLGTSNGWLLTNPLYGYDHLILVNPILNARMQIIPQHHCGDSRIKKLLVVEARVASGDYTVVVLSNASRLIVYINSEFYEQGFTAAPSADIAFYKGKIHGLVIREGRFEIHVSRLDTVLERLYVVRGIAMKGTDKAYLVESRGELLIVREHHNKNFDPTGEFEVFKLVMANGFANAVKLQSLGDQALFCGSDGCISLPVGEFSLFEENHIYFIASRLHWSCVVHGVSLKDGSIKRISTCLPILSSAITNLWWFLPTTKDITV